MVRVRNKVRSKQRDMFHENKSIFASVDLIMAQWASFFFFLPLHTDLFYAPRSVDIIPFFTIYFTLSLSFLESDVRLTYLEFDLLRLRWCTSALNKFGLILMILQELLRMKLPLLHRTFSQFNSQP